MKPTLLVLAAGMGSRYGGLKQLDGFGPNGETIIDYSIYDAISSGFGKIIFIIKEENKAIFEKTFLPKIGDRLEVAFTYQRLADLPIGFSLPESRAKPWGTAHAILAARHEVTTPFAVINADDFYGPGSYRIMANYLKTNPSDYAMVGFQLAHTLSEYGSVNRGVCQIDEQGYLIGIEEIVKINKQQGKITYPTAKGNKPLAANTVVSMNLFGLPASFFAYCTQYFADFLNENIAVPNTEFYLPTVINLLLASKKIRLKVLTSPEKWFGITYREDKPFVQAAINKLNSNFIYPQKLW